MNNRAETGRTAIAGLVTMLLAGCAGSGELALVNASGRDIAFFPGVVVRPCETVRLTKDQVAAAERELDTWLARRGGSFGFVPAGALFYFPGPEIGRLGSTLPRTVVISSVAPPQVLVTGSPGEPPDCVGEPIGAEDVSSAF